MTPMELALECKRCIEANIERVCIVVPGPPPRYRRIRLARSEVSPLGEVANWQDDPPRTVAYFNAIDVLAWLTARGAIHLTVRFQPPCEPSK